MMGRRTTLVLFSLMLACGSGVHGQTVPVEPQTFYVDASYSGPELGTSQKPYSHIGAALLQTVAGRGDQVIVRRGSYAESVRVPVATSLISEEGATHTLVEGGAGVSSPLIRLEIGAVLRGLSVGNATGVAVELLEAAAAEITNCVFHHSTTGLRVDAAAMLRCTNNTFYGNATGLRAEAGAQVLPLENTVLAENSVAISVADTATVDSHYDAFFKNDVSYEGEFVPGDTDFVSNPLFTDAEHLVFHLSQISNLRNGGDPDPAFRDRDGSRNDVSADGGPYGVIDLLAPQVVVTTTPSPSQGAAPFALLVDASGSQDEWGIASWEWDINARDGLGFADGNGATLPFLFDTPGGYLVSVRATDNSGLSDIAMFSVRVGTPPQVVRLEPAPGAGPAPLTVEFPTEAVSLSGGDLSFAWDFNGDGTIESTAESPSFTYPQGTVPGLYRVSLVLTDDQQVSTQVLTPVTISAYPVAASVGLRPGVATELAVENNQSPLNGTRVTVPAGAVSERMTLAVCEVPLSAIPLKPAGTLLSVFDLAPSNVLLSQSVTVDTPVSETLLDETNVKVSYWEPESQAWFDAGITKTRVKNGSVSFDTSHFTTFAIARTGPEAGGPCFIATAAYGTSLVSEIAVLREIRDTRLLGNALGTACVDVYYRFSPPIAEVVAAHPALAMGVRALLWTVVLLVHMPALTAAIPLVPVVVWGRRRLVRLF